MDVFFGFVFLFLLVAMYILPCAIALNRGHHNAAAIIVLNLFLGWTFFGWVWALVWAFTATHKEVVN